MVRVCIAAWFVRPCRFDPNTLCISQKRNRLSEMTQDILKKDDHYMNERKFMDHSNEVLLKRNKISRFFFIILGTIFVGWGVAGIFLPLVPTTPFLLLAAACYARGSVRFYNWLLNNKYLGSYIKDWRTGRGIPLHAKIITCLLIAVAFGYSIIFVVHSPIFEVALILLAIGMSLYIVTRPTRRISNKDGG